MPDSSLGQSGAWIDSTDPRQIEAAQVRVLLDRLAKRAKAVTIAEGVLEHERKGRDHVIRLLLDAGCSERKIARAAGISGPAVHQVKERG